MNNDLTTIRRWSDIASEGRFRAESADWCNLHTMDRDACGCEWNDFLNPLAQFARDRVELAELPPPKPLISETLDRQSLALLAGPWAVGKSFVALDWALCIASDVPWQGRAVHTRGHTVLYVAAEGFHGLDARISAWESSRKTPVPRHSFLALPMPITFGSGRVTEICRMIYDQQVDFVVIDTLARCAEGLDENSAKDVGLIVRELDRIRDATDGGTVLVVHHTGKDGKTVRGSSALEAAMDTVYQIEGDSQSMLLKRTKRKDGPLLDKLALRLEPVPSTGSVVVANRKVDTTPTVERLMSTFVQVFKDTGASKAELRAAVEMSPGSFHRAINRALEQGLLVNIGTERRPNYQLGEDHQ